MDLIDPFDVSIRSEPARLSDLRHALRDWLRSAEVAEEAQDAIVLAVHEAVANGIEHGARGSPIAVSGCLMDRDLIFEVSTRGAWTPRAGSDDALDERGRGLALMAALLDGLEILVNGERVVVRLRSASVQPDGRSV